MVLKVSIYTHLKTVGEIRLRLLGLNLLVICGLLQFKVPLCLRNLNIVDVACSKTLFFGKSFLKSHHKHTYILVLLPIRGQMELLYQ